MNVLLITFDQFRGDCLSAAGHPVVKTPSLDRLAAGVSGWLAITARPRPAAPAGRASTRARTSSTTGWSGTGRRSTTASTTSARGGAPGGLRADDLRVRRPGSRSEARDGIRGTRVLSNYQGFPPGFEVGLDLPDEQDAWSGVARGARLRAVPRR